MQDQAARRGNNATRMDRFGNSSELFASVLKNIEMGIVILDTGQGEVVYANDHARELLSGDAGGRIEYAMAAHLFREEAVSEEGETPARPRKEIVEREGRILGYSRYRAPGREDGLVLLMRDITDQQRLASIAESIELSNHIGFIFSGIRHEIGNPLNSVKMALSVLARNLDRLTKEEFQTYFARMDEDIAKIESLLKAFKNFNMFERPVASNVNLEEFFDSFLQLTRSDPRRQGVKVAARLGDDAVNVSVDPRGLHQVVMNLFANALDALERREGGRIDFVSRRSGDAVLLSCIDNGCGMSEEQKRNLFRPFYTSKINGTGLGLVIVKKMLAQMGCDIGVRSENGKGTTVTLTLPARPSPPF